MASVNRLDELHKWTILTTENYKRITNILTQSLKYSLFQMITLRSGAGKSTSFSHFANKNSNTILLTLDKTFTAKDLYISLLRLIDVHDYTYDIRIRFLATALSEELNKKKGKWLIIVDDAGRMKSDTLEYFQQIVDSTGHKVGFILAGTEKFKIDFDNWKLKLRTGIPELATRIHSWHELTSPSHEELKEVARKNGVDERDLITVCDKNCKDLRTLKNEVIKYRIKSLE